MIEIESDIDRQQIFCITEEEARSRRYREVSFPPQPRGSVHAPECCRKEWT